MGGTRHFGGMAAALHLSGGGASSTIDYSAGTMPVSGSSRRPRSTSKNRNHTIAVVGSYREGGITEGMATLQEGQRRDESYYERKYRKSKRRIKRLISDHETEKSRLYDLHQINNNSNSMINQVHCQRTSVAAKGHNEAIMRHIRKEAHSKLVTTIFSVWRTCSLARSATLAQRL